MVRQLTRGAFDAFVAKKPAAVILFDAGWDASYQPVARRRLADAEKELADRASFGEVDVDAEKELAKSLKLLNVPLFAYYRDGKLIAKLTGVQNVRARLARVLRGEPIGYKDGTDENAD